MKRVLIVVGAVVALLVVAVLVAPLLVPKETIRNQVIAQVKAATGRDLVIGGELGISVFPTAGVRIDRVAFANVPGAANRDMVTLSQLKVDVDLVPLLSGNVSINSFVLVEPVIRLEIDRQGQANWDFAGAETPATAPQPGRSGGSAPPASASGSFLNELRLGDVRIENGTVYFSDARSGRSEEVSKINVSLTLPNLDSRFTGKGGVTWNGEAVELDISVEKPRALLTASASTDAKVALKAKPVTLSYTGAVTGGSPLGAEGAVDLDIPSLRGLAAWTKNPLDAPPNTMGPVKIRGLLALAGGTVSFTGADIAFDAIRAKGDVSVDTAGAVPTLAGRLDVAKLDLNPYIPEKSDGGSAAPGTGGGGAAGGQGRAADTGWSNDPIDLSPLKAANVRFDLSVQELILRKIQVGKSALGINLTGGKLVANLKELALYQGQGSGTVTVDGSAAVPAIAADMKLQGLQAEPFLRDAADFQRLTGTGAADISVTARGKSQREIVAALNGKGAATFRDGAIKGINLGAMVRNIGSAFLDSQAGRAQQTDFAELGGTFTIANGLLRNNDLALRSPLLRVEGAGTVNLPAQTVDYRIEPKLVADATGQGGAQQVAGLAVPVKVTGPWSNISWQPDLAGAIQQNLRNPGAAVDSLRNLIPGQRQQQTAPAPATQPQQQPANPLGTLRNLLGR